VNTVLIADDDSELRAVLSDILRGEDFSVIQASNGRSALESFKNKDIDAVLLDLKMPQMSGMDTMREMLSLDKNTKIVILTAHGDIETAVQAVKEGAYDFIAKPPDFDKLVITLRRATEQRSLERTVCKTRVALDLSLEERFGKSSAMKKVISQIKQVAETNFSVVVQGETGTGKSYVAHSIHTLSSRAKQPFVRVDIGLIPDQLIESELFGYRMGAFTGAARSRDGYFREADGGTLFIDDMENMSSSVQQKMLTVVDEKKIFPLGSSSPTSLDVRIIAATNKDLWQCVERGEIRSDLYYRLGEYIITLPPLRERQEEIPYFAKKFLLEVCDELKKPVPDMPKDALLPLERHGWPGNLRELRNVMRKVALASGVCDVDAALIRDILSGQVSAGKAESACSSLREAVREVEKRMIRLAIEKTKGNKSRAAELLKISYPTLLSKLRDFHLDN
jgi:DNA-binding NtrC family response regulator